MARIKKNLSSSGPDGWDPDDHAGTILALAHEFKTDAEIAEACGIHPNRFYEYKAEVDEYGMSTTRNIKLNNLLGLGKIRRASKWIARLLEVCDDNNHPKQVDTIFKMLKTKFPEEWRDNDSITVNNVTLQNPYSRLSIEQLENELDKDNE